MSAGTSPQPAGRRGIERRVITLVLTGMVATVGLLGAVASREYRLLEAEVRQSRLAVATGAASHLDELLSGLMGELQGLSGSPQIVDMLDGNAAPSDAPLRDLYLRSGVLDGAFLADASGRVVASAPAGHTDDCDPGAIRQALATGRPVVTGLRLVEGRPTTLCALVPLRSRPGTFRGVAGAVLAPGTRRFGRLVAPIVSPAMSPLHLVDLDERVITSTDGLPVGTVLVHRGAESGAEVRLSVAPWHVVAMRPSLASAADEGWRPRTLAWLLPALLVLALVFAWGAARSVRRPLLVLTGEADRLAAGDLERAIPPLGDDEVGRLGAAFEQMRVALKRSLDDIAAANDALEARVADRTRELAQLYEELQEREQARLALLRKVISAQEDERKRLARELHDETCQTLAALGVRLDVALSAVGDGPARRAIDEARALASRSLDEVRRMMYDLRPAVLDDLGLVPAITWYAERTLASRGIEVRVEAEIGHELPKEVETPLFRVVQEVLTNVARHARAEHVLVQLTDEDDRLRIEVEDDGVGFDPGTVAPARGGGRGWGLMGIRERVDLVGGRLEINSSPGSGAHVVIEVPLPQGDRHG